MLIDLDAPVQWKAVLLDLKRWGWTLKGVAAAINAPPSTLKRWWNDGSEPRFEYGRALLKLHGIVEKRSSDPARGGAGLQPFRPQETDSMKRKPTPRQPGTEETADAPQPEQAPGESNVDEAIALAGQGKARKIAKPRAAVAPSKVKGDPDRPADAPVNMHAREMPYAEAMKLYEASFELARLEELQHPSDVQKQRMLELRPRAMKRSILTERGWVAMPNKKPQGVGV